MTTLKNLIMNHSWHVVKESLFHLYPSELINVSSYEKMYQYLQTSNAINNTEHIKVLIEKEIVKEEYFNWDVSGIYPDTDEKYALGLTDWKDWLGYNIHENTLSSLNNIEIIAHCLYEMSFYGFTNDSIQNEVKIINESSRKIEKGEFKLQKELCSYCLGTKIDNILNKKCIFCDEEGMTSILIENE